MQRSALKEHISKLMTEGGQGAGGMFAQLMGKRGEVIPSQFRFSCFCSDPQLLQINLATVKFQPFLSQCIRVCSTQIESNQIESNYHWLLKLRTYTALPHVNYFAILSQSRFSRVQEEEGASRRGGGADCGAGRFLHPPIVFHRLCLSACLSAHCASSCLVLSSHISAQLSLHPVHSSPLDFHQYQKLR